MFEGFDTGRAAVNGSEIAYVTGGNGPPVLLLHGFPQTHALWARIAPALAETHRVVCADLRGYGASSKPEGVAAYSFREMAADMAALMTHLGHDRFDLIGHDRGARTAHRLALDHEARVRSLVVMDIIPTQLLLDELTTPVAKGYYHWFFLAQPAPFPERLIGADPDYYFESCLLGWGESKLEDFAPDQLAAYREAWRAPDAIAGMCNDYRAALEIDVLHDRADLNRRVTCPALVLYGADGPMGRAYDVPATWAERFSDMRAKGLPGGHFFIDQSPEATLTALRDFL